jgi:hypothetical protein
MCTAGLVIPPLRTVEHISDEKRGGATLDDNFIQRHGTSTLMGLTDSQYRAGIDRVKPARLTTARSVS